MRTLLQIAAPKNKSEFSNKRKYKRDKAEAEFVQKGRNGAKLNVGFDVLHLFNLAKRCSWNTELALTLAGNDDDDPGPRTTVTAGDADDDIKSEDS